MLHCCGQTQFQLRLNSGGFAINVTDDNNYTPSLTKTTIQLYTAYLGQVTVDVSGTGETISLEKYHTVNNKQLLVKVLDSQEHNLSDQKQYQLNMLKSLSAKKINIRENKYHYVLTLLCVKKLAQINNNSTLVTQVDILIQPFLTDTDLITKATQDYPDLITPTPTKSVNQYKKLYQTIVSYNSSVDIFNNTFHRFDALLKLQN